MRTSASEFVPTFKKQTAPKQTPSVPAETKKIEQIKPTEEKKVEVKTKPNDAKKEQQNKAQNKQNAQKSKTENQKKADEPVRTVVMKKVDANEPADWSNAKFF